MDSAAERAAEAEAAGVVHTAFRLHTDAGMAKLPEIVEKTSAADEAAPPDIDREPPDHLRHILRRKAESEFHDTRPGAVAGGDFAGHPVTPGPDP